MSRIRANTITNLTIDGPPTVSTGLQVTGVCTATSFDGSIAGFVTAIGSGANLTGIVTATTLEATTATVGSAVTITSGGQTLINTTNNGGDAEYPLIVSGRANDATDSGRVNIKRGEAAASMTAGDSIGDITFTALDGGNAAQIAVKAGTGWGGTSDSPGELLFQTTPDGSGTLVERLRISADGKAGFTGIVTALKFEGPGNIPVNSQTSGTYTLVASDAGKAIVTDQDIIVPDSIFTAGDAVTIVNDAGSGIVITKGTNMYYTADATNGNKTLNTRGMATLYFTTPTTCYISGGAFS